MIRASVVVPTRNRVGSLGRCLDGLDAQTVDRCSYEVIVVDNGSSDGTRELVQRRLDDSGLLRYAFVGTVGPSPARNAGIDLARGEIIALTDDDAVPSPAWLAALLDGHARWAEVAALAGRTELRLAGPRPAWLHEGMETWYSARDLGAAPRVLEHECPWGVNASVRADVARAIGGFDGALGPGADGWLVNEDLEFFRRVRAAGHGIGYVPDALVAHEISRTRMSRRWVLRRTFAQGRSDAVLDARRTTLRATHRDTASRAARATVRGWRSLARNLAVADRRDRVLLDDLMRRSEELGYVYGTVTAERHEQRAAARR